MSYKATFDGVVIMPDLQNFPYVISKIIFALSSCDDSRSQVGRIGTDAFFCHYNF